MFRAAVASNLYTQYHCFPWTLKVNKDPSFCHSIIRKIKLEFTKIFPHQLNGIKATKKSPHFPWPLRLVLIIGLSGRALLFHTFKIIYKYSDQNNENQNHHQYCHWDRWIKISDLWVGNPKLKFCKVEASVIIWPHTLY